MTDQRNILDALQKLERQTHEAEDDYVVCLRVTELRAAISEITAHRAEIEKLQENLEAMHDAAFAATVVADPPQPERWETWTAVAGVDAMMTWEHCPFAAWSLPGDLIRYVFRRVSP